MYISLHVKYPLLLSDFNETWIFARQIFDKTSVSNFIKIRRFGAELLHEAGRTDMMKLIVAFRYFANAPKNYLHPNIFFLNKLEVLYTVLFHKRLSR